MKQDLNEAETRAELIDPALVQAGWGKVDGSRVRREVITLGRLTGGGKRGNQDIADYVLVYRDQKLAVIEAKKVSLPDTEGVGQAKRYATKLQTRFAYSTNGIGIYRVDMETGDEGYVDCYPTPDELWNATFTEPNSWRDRFSDIPFEDKGGTWEARYYQHNAINQALKAIADGKDRILLTMATGTGKTFIAFQLAWKLFHSRWNLKDWKSGDRTQSQTPYPLSCRPQHPCRSSIQRLFRIPRGCTGQDFPRCNPQERDGPEKRQHLFYHFPDLHVRN